MVQNLNTADVMKTWYNVSEINRLPEELYNLQIADDRQLSSWAASDISAQWFTL